MDHDEKAGCGCLVLIALVFAVAGGFWQGIAALAGVWLLYLVFVGVSAGIILWIVKAIAGD